MASFRKEKNVGKSRRSNTIYDSDLLNSHPIEGFVKKIYRRKVRATEDFNHLNRSSLALDSNVHRVCSDSDSKKTRKQKVMNFLPEVVWAEKENLMLNVEENILKQKGKRTSSGSKVNRNSQFESSTEPTSESTSEGEKSVRRKLRRRKRTLVQVNQTRTSSRGIKSPTPNEKMVKKIKHVDKSLKDNSNNSFIKITSENLSGEPIEKTDYLEKTTEDKRKQILIEMTTASSSEEMNRVGMNTEDNRNNSFTEVTSETSSDELVEKSKCHVKRTKLNIVNNSKNLNEQTYLEDPDLEFKTKRKNKKVKNVNPSNNDCYLTKKASYRRSKSLNGSKPRNSQNKSSMKIDTTNINNQSSNSDISPDEVLNQTFEINEPVNKQNVSKIELRKSVRFLSPRARNSNFGKSSILPYNSVIDVSSNMSNGIDSKIEKKTFRKSTPHVKKLRLPIVDKKSMPKENLEYSTEDTQESGDEICKTNITDRNISFNASRLSNNRKSVNIGKHSQLVKGKYITPIKKVQSVEILGNISPNISENMLKNSKLSTTKSAIKSILRHRSSFATDTEHDISKPKFQNRSTFNLPSPIHYRSTRSIKTPSESKQQSVINLITPTPEKDKVSVTISDSTLPGSIRGDTFSIDDDRTSNIEVASFNIQREHECNRTADKFKSSDDDLSEGTSKVQKRKRWNKSLGVSFLDNTGNLQNILPPLSDETFPELFLNSNETDLNLIETVKTPKQKVSSTKKIIVPCGSSTPLVRTRKMSEKEKNTSNTINVSASISKPVTRTKMPNFALIHQRAYDKLENLKEMSERKAARAKQLLSGHKPNTESSLKSPSKSRKILKYSPKLGKRAIPTLKTSTMKNKNVAVNVMSNKLIVPSTSNPKVGSLPKTIQRKVQPTNIKSCIPKPILKKVNEDKKTLTRLGFKIHSEAAKKPSKEDQMKALSAKSKIINNSVESRRNVVQNIRTNRRFELLMKMRNKK